jgi:quinol monooxygenase YgiN
MNIQLIITFNVREEKLPAFEQLMQQVKSSLPHVTGCENVRVYRSKADRCVFTLVETWESESAHRAHFMRLVQSGDWDFVRSHLSGDPASGYYDELPVHA